MSNKFEASTFLGESLTIENPKKYVLYDSVASTITGHTELASIVSVEVIGSEGYPNFSKKVTVDEGGKWSIDLDHELIKGST